MIEVNVVPKSQKTEIIQMNNTTFKIKLTAPPEKEKANNQCIALLAEFFNIKKNAITIVSGHHSKKKKIAIKRK
ncbi:MAG: hypothetical protein A2Y62_15020 [Candidatus Fischerbacteria bacterium RBG_13_37_8]|uniref:Uncharacterized protein n=1 Tax=Candidatus Fischerbacteria bacterium RBG_13_37_8 TaxID=1817863 RepID=A0A1F5V4R3_9BACT|nr:MAG: hypothetical protein A2Y62_15020 [Candidatus Fischerbacteria bacterium RBG_13_37_8]